MRALVTGAAGFVGSEIVFQLLAKGYDVVATARSVGDSASAGGGRCSHLLKLASALPGTLELKAADLLKEGSFDEACRGCDFIFHVASPFILATSDPQRELLDPALCGTVNLLSSAARENERRRASDEEQEKEASGTKKKEARRPLRVVLTSSVAAVHGEFEAPPRSGSLYSEEDWNETSSVANGQAYHLSKVMAEKEAWRVAEAKGIDLVTVNPNFVLGPALSAAPDGGGSLSVSYVKAMVEGSRAASGSPIICDVRDVARAHVVAAENPEAKGRYIVSQPGAVLPEAMAEAVGSAVRDAGFGKEAALLPAAEAAPAGETGKARIDARRTVEELGVLLRSPEETLRDAARSLIKLGVAVPASKV